MGTSLYELKGKFAILLEWLEEGADDPEALEDTLEAISGEIEVKSEGYAFVIRQMDADIKALDDEITFLQEKKSRAVKNQKRLKEAVKDAIILIGKGKEGIKAGPFTLKVAGNGGKMPMVIDKPDEVPETFKKVVVENDNERIRKFLEELDQEDTCSWAHLEPRGSHLAIR